MQAVAAELAGYAGKFRCLEITMLVDLRVLKQTGKPSHPATPDFLTWLTFDL